jgi:hypothetical protein
LGARDTPWPGYAPITESDGNTLESRHFGPAPEPLYRFLFRGAEMAKRERWLEIPTELSLEQFEEFVLPHLSAGIRVRTRSFRRTRFSIIY